MTDGRDAGTKLLQDVVRFKRQRNEARAETERQAALLAELQLELIAVRVRGRLLRFEDFHHHIGVPAVLLPGGRINDRKLDLLVSDLLRRRQELAAPTPDVSGLRYPDLDSAEEASGPEHVVEMSPVGNTQQSGARACEPNQGDTS
jgi:hypothetical protein